MRRRGIVALGILIAVAATIALFRADLMLRVDRLCRSDRDCVRVSMGKSSEVVGTQGRAHAEARLKAADPVECHREIPNFTPTEVCRAYQCRTELIPGGHPY